MTVARGALSTNCLPLTACSLCQLGNQKGQEAKRWPGPASAPAVALGRLPSLMFAGTPSPPVFAARGANRNKDDSHTPCLALPDCRGPGLWPCLTPYVSGVSETRGSTWGEGAPSPRVRSPFWAVLALALSNRCFATSERTSDPPVVLLPVDKVVKRSLH